MLDNTPENPYEGVTTIDQIDIYSGAYTQEYIRYLCSLELSKNLQLSPPPWHRKYRRKKYRPKKQIAEVPLDNYTLSPRKEKSPSKQVQKLKQKGVTPKKWSIPAEEDFSMIEKKLDRGRQVFVSVVESIDDKYIVFGNITQQNTGRVYEETSSMHRKRGIEKHGFVVGDLVSFEARLWQINTGYTSYGENIDDSVVRYRFATCTKHQKLN